MPTLDPADYLAEHLADWPAPVVVYRAVSKYAPAELGFVACRPKTPRGS